MFIVLETHTTKDNKLVPRHAHGPFHLYEDAQLAVEIYEAAVPNNGTYFFTIMEVGDEDEECSHEWEHDEASNEFTCTRCDEIKGG